MENKNAIHAAANALASPQANCLEFLGVAQSAYDALTTDYPSYQAEAASALEAKNSVTASCQTLLQYGTAAEIKQEANANMATMWSYHTAASQAFNKAKQDK